MCRSERLTVEFCFQPAKSPFYSLIFIAELGQFETCIAVYFIIAIASCVAPHRNYDTSSGLVNVRARCFAGRDINIFLFDSLDFPRYIADITPIQRPFIPTC